MILNSIQSTITRKQVQITSDPDTIRSCWLNHFTQLTTFPISVKLQLSPTDHQKNLNFLSRMNCDNILDEDFTIEEIEARQSWRY